jgi:hypothetical protein
MAACPGDPSGRQILVPLLLTDAQTVLEPFPGKITRKALAGLQSARSGMRSVYSAPPTHRMPRRRPGASQRNCRGVAR